MNEEEKAIEILQEFKKTGYHTLSLKYNEDRIHTNKLIERALETVLNLIETQKAEIENKEKQIEKYINMLATNDMLHVLECENKDKIISLMAEQLTTPINDKKWVIEYYTRLAEEKSND